MTKFTLSLLTAAVAACMCGGEAYAGDRADGALAPASENARSLRKPAKELRSKPLSSMAHARFAEEAEDGLLYSCSFAFLTEGTEADPAELELDDWDNIPEELIGEENYGFGGQGLMQAGGAMYIPFEYNAEPDSPNPWYMEGLMWTPDIYEPMEVAIELDVKIVEGCGYDSDELWTYANDYVENLDFDSGEITTEWTHLSLKINAKNFEPESDDDSYYLTLFAEGGADIVVKNFEIKDASQVGAIGIAAETAGQAAVSYYNLQGQRISNPARGSVVIRVCGPEVKKVVF